ncbi:MAG: DNA polymerase Y family protein [Litorimonas sp.]
MKRVLYIWLPQLPLDLQVRKGDPRVDAPFAIITEIKNAWRLMHVSEAAREAGLSEGVSLADARAICPTLLTEPVNEARSAALLRALWRWADHLSPWVALDTPDGLFLDITGCSHLFGGEVNMGEKALERLEAMNITARIGIADTKGAAAALARFGRATVEVSESGQTIPTMRAYPVEGLRLAQKTSSDLRRAGLKTIGQLSEIKTSELARRFGLDLTKALAATLGHAPDPISPRSADPIYAARMTLPDPIGLKDDLISVLDRLVTSVCKRLEKDANGARRYYLTVRCVDTGDHVLQIGFARPTFEMRAVLQQFGRPLDALKIEYGADWFRLEAAHIEPIQPFQISLDQHKQTQNDTSKIISTLGNKLGFDRVRQFHPIQSHLPEREFVQVEAMDRRDPAVWKIAPRKRPVRLFRRPERLVTLEPGRPPKRFQWRRSVYSTYQANGPERLSSEWWQADGGAVRDYWHVQTQDGPRFWLMTYPGAPEPSWYIAGRFA